MQNILISIAFVSLSVFVASAEAHEEKQGPTPPNRLELVDAKENTVLGAARQLTFSGSKSGEGYFSADGKQMIFQSDREPGNPFYQIYWMDLASGQTRRLSPGVGKTTCSWLHPKEQKALFSSTHLDPDARKKQEMELKSKDSPTRSKYSWSYDESFDIFEVSLKNPKQMKRLTKEKGYDAEASYSPDGKWIAFASNRAGYTEKLNEEEAKLFHQDPSYMMDIYIMKSDGTGVKQLTTARGYDGGPFFSADGKKITWRHFSADGQTAEIHTMNLDGSGEKQLTRLGAMSWAPFFHPSGDYLIFTTNIHGYENFELYIVDAEGQHKPVRVTFSDGFDGLPVFTPSGDQVAWTKKSANGDSQIYIAQWDDQQARKLLGLPLLAPVANELSPEIREADMRKQISYLASADFAGRKTGSPEEKIYTQALAQLFKSFGLQPGGDGSDYIQKFEFTSNVALGSKNKLELSGPKDSKALEVSKDWTPLSFSSSGAVQPAGVVFAGYGIVAPATNGTPGYDSYKDIDVHGKWVLAFRDIPMNISGPARQNLNLYARAQHKATVARQRGAIGLILVNGPNSPAPSGPMKLKYEGALSDSSIAIVSVANPVGEAMVSFAGKKLKALQDKLDTGAHEAGFEIPGIRLAGEIDLQAEKSTGMNVIASLKVPGATRTVMIGAHGDHLGLGDSGNSLATSDEKSKIHFGADDNASGVSGVLELAQYFSQPKVRARLKQNLVFAVWSGEEIGVLGSAHYTKTVLGGSGPAKQSPLSAYINLDMIGRLRQQLFVQGVGSAPQWKGLLERLGPQFAFGMTPQEDPYLPTDAVSFYLAGVPSISFFTGSHSEYHTPRDTPDLINYPGAVESTKTIGRLVELLASAPRTAVTYRKVEGSRKDLGAGRQFRVYLGTIPDYSQEGVKGVRISGVTKESPAETAKLAGGDVIVELDKNKIENLYDYVYALQAMPPGKQTSIVVLRNGQRVELAITPKLKD